ncbi:membrane protein insertion efficiency factor YidD [Helicobacter monodelphidis]|uniref:membrane protein insertion efficiency factor YidD n=1 Tax=Helicobacter sp. 15-1451 TaxID=2004995 RepID=UPI000DCEA6C2|nr:membrane protein insertion efficiency factor YidD [Helicobacter sp. 15-1451]RAX56948.1 membrane protein insertion efficiency factor YidD [Helicobacter sp. 15-1451]
MKKDINSFFIKLCRGYQLWISPLIGGSSCRHYPTCSEYCMWLLGSAPLYWTILQSFYRVVRCHPFAKGGIDYPIVFRRYPILSLQPKSDKRIEHKIKVVFWLVPFSTRQSFFGQRFYLIKSQ